LTSWSRTLWPSDCMSVLAFRPNIQRDVGKTRARPCAECAWRRDRARVIRGRTQAPVLYYEYKLKGVIEPDCRVVVCERETFSALNLGHAADEIRTAFPDASVCMICPRDLCLRGGRMLIVWPVRDACRPGKLPPVLRAALKSGIPVAFLDPRHRRMAVVTRATYRAWRHRWWIQEVLLLSQRFSRWFLVRAGRRHD